MASHRHARSATVIANFPKTGGESFNSEFKEQLETVDLVNHPPHYKRGGLECIDVIEALRLPYHLGNALKYLWRAGEKDPMKTSEDLRKCIWYIERYVALLKKE